eukprot:TRINITY_DN1893_c0_g1_i1.p1 TRINITY_DN1893_c0_g1~~TRINITY_DN1893_c0_g1_i1.p1  ORF type:complete len:103 (-),score=27.41 TRINITY_DN1893_c0_g1_i1:1239-1517(-)
MSDDEDSSQDRSYTWKLPKSEVDKLVQVIEVIQQTGEVPDFVYPTEEEREESLLNRPYTPPELLFTVNVQIHRGEDGTTFTFEIHQPHPVAG